MIEIKLPKCLLVLTEQELQSLLTRDPTLWATALQRGKAVMRARKIEHRAKKGGRQW